MEAEIRPHCLGSYGEGLRQTRLIKQITSLGLSIPIPWLDLLNDIVGMSVEFLAALLVAAEVVVLLMGVIWRYVLHTPLVWSDELASILLLWLAMLGSIVALRRGENNLVLDEPDFHVPMIPPIGADGKSLWIVVLQKRGAFVATALLVGL